MFKHLQKPSTYLAFITWGSSMFTTYPSMANFIVHFLIIPAALTGMLWLAHWEGKDVASDR